MLGVFHTGTSLKATIIEHYRLHTTDFGKCFTEHTANSEQYPVQKRKSVKKLQEQRPVPYLSGASHAPKVIVMNTTVNMQSPSARSAAIEFVEQAIEKFQKIPGSSIVIRYIRSSYQNDPVRSAMELFLFLFAVYYLVSPSYSTKQSKNVPLTDEVGIQLYKCARVVLTASVGD